MAKNPMKAFVKMAKALTNTDLKECLEPVLKSAQNAKKTILKKFVNDSEAEGWLNELNELINKLEIACTKDK